MASYKTKAAISEGIENLFALIGENKIGENESEQLSLKRSLEGKELPNDIKRHFDVLIVGSGYGASIAAHQIAQAVETPRSSIKGLRGWTVGILERGREFHQGSFPAFDSESIREMRFTIKGGKKCLGTPEGLFDLRLGPDLNVLQANGLGGGSLINAGVLERAKFSVFDAWPKFSKEKNEDQSPKPVSFWEGSEATLDRQYEKAERLLFPRKPVIREGDSMGYEIVSRPNDQFLKDIKKHKEIIKRGENLNELTKPARISISTDENLTNEGGKNLDQCIKCGDCATGCNHNAKNSLDQNLLLSAKRKLGENLSIYTGASVLKFYRVGDDREGWLVEVVYTDPVLRDRQKYDSYLVYCNKLILAAGSLGTTELMMKSQSPDLQFSKKLGKKFSSNGDLITGVYNPAGEDINAMAYHPTAGLQLNNEDVYKPAKRNVGPSITGMIDVRNDKAEKNRQEFVVQEMAVPAAMNRVFREIFTTAKSLRDIGESDLSFHNSENFKEPNAIELSVNSLSKWSLYASMGLDDADGELNMIESDWVNTKASEINEGILSVNWKGLRKKKTFKAQVEFLKKLYKKSTATVLQNPIWTPLDQKVSGILSVGRGPLLKKLYKKPTATVLPNPIWTPLDKNVSEILSVGHGPLLTVHPLGGCSIGVNEREGVANYLGQVYKPSETNTSKEENPVHPGLHILDGSLMPRAVGINPALTIATTCLSAIEELIEIWNEEEKKSGHASSYVEKKLPNVEFDLPEVVRKNLGTISESQPKPTEVTINERLIGECKLESDDGSTKNCVVELTLLTKEKEVVNIFGSDATEKSRNFDLDSEKSKLRILYRRDWEDIRAKDFKGDAYERALDDAAKFICKLSEDDTNSIAIFIRKKSWILSRLIAGGLAYKFNRLGRELAINNDREESEGLKSKHYYFFKRLCSIPIFGCVLSFIGGIFKAIRNRSTIYSYIPYLASAGEKRTMRYRFSLSSIPLKFDDFRDFQEKKFEGFKVITYSKRSNPWRQLSEVNFDMGKGSVLSLCLDTNYLAKQRVPLLQIVDQENQSQALTEVASFFAGITRMIFGIHFLSFRKPDQSPEKMIDRFAGKAPGLPDPIRHYIKVAELEKDYKHLKAGSDVFIRLTEYRNNNEEKPPVLMVHGYSASSTTFAHHSLPNSLAKTVFKDGRSVWLIDLRTSCALPTAIYPWKFEDVSMGDFPAAIKFIVDTYRKRNQNSEKLNQENGVPNSGASSHRLVLKSMSEGNEKIDIVAHCMGAVMLSMAILQEDFEFSTYDKDGKPDLESSKNIFNEHIGRIAFNQATPTVLFTAENNFRSFITTYFKELIPENYRFRPDKENEDDYSLFDRFLHTLPYPEAEFDLYNPRSKKKPYARYARTRHRMDALYGRTFELANLSKKVLDNLDDFFGPINIDTLAQVNLFASRRVATNYEGKNLFVSYDNLQDRWKYHTFSIHAKNNGMLDYSTKHRTHRIFSEAGVPYYSEMIDAEHIGHQDSMIGKDAHKYVFPRILAFLNSTDSFASESIGLPPRAYDNDLDAFSSDWHIEPPEFGPVLIDRNWIEKSTRNASFRVGFGTNPAISSIPIVLLLPVVKQIDKQTDSSSGRLRVAGQTQSERNKNLESFIDWSSSDLKPLSVETTLIDQNWLVIEPTNDKGSLFDFEKPNLDGFLLLLAYPNHIMEYETAGDGTSGQDMITYSQRHSSVGATTRRGFDKKELTHVVGKLLASRKNTYDYFKTAVIDKDNFKNVFGLHPRPSKNSPGSFSFVVGSCQYPAGILDQIPAYASYQALSEYIDIIENDNESTKPKFLALLGDQIYADATAGFMDPTTNYDRYIQPYWNLFGNKSVRNVTRKMPILTVIDDHELVDNWEPTRLQNNLEDKVKKTYGNSLDPKEIEIEALIYEENKKINKFIEPLSLIRIRKKIVKRILRTKGSNHGVNVFQRKAVHQTLMDEFDEKEILNVLKWRTNYRNKNLDHLMHQVTKNTGLVNIGKSEIDPLKVSGIVVAQLRSVLKAFMNESLLGSQSNMKLEQRRESFDQGKRSFLLYQRGFENAYKLKPNELRQKKLYGRVRHDGRNIYVCDVRTEREARYAENGESTKIFSDSQKDDLLLFLEGKYDNSKSDSESRQLKTIATDDDLLYVLSSSIFLPRHKLPHGGTKGSIRLDGWDGYPASLHAILEKIADAEIDNVVFVSGDEHLGCYAEAKVVRQELDNKSQKTKDLKTGNLVSIHSPGLYTPFPFANGRIENFTNNIEIPENLESREELRIDEFTWVSETNKNMTYTCTVYAHFDFEGQGIRTSDEKTDSGRVGAKEIKTWMDYRKDKGKRRLRLKQIKGFLHLIEVD